MRKPVLENSSNVPLQKNIKSRLNQWLHNEWGDLIKAFEADMVTVAETSSDTFGSDRDPLESNYQKATALIQTGQLRRARQAILSTGASDPTIPHMRDQTRRKFPIRKRAILEPTPAQYSNDRASLDFDIFRDTIKFLKPLTASGLGGLRNEHLTALVYNERSNVSIGASTALSKVHRLCCEITQGNVPWYFLSGWVATSLSAVNKIDPRDLEPGHQMDFRPVAMGNSLRKVTTEALLAPYKDVIIDATKPTQFGCGESAGGIQMVFSLKLQQESILIM